MGASVGVPDELAEDSEAVCHTLIGMGFTEAFNTYLTNEAQCFDMVRRKYDEDSVVRVAYAKTETLSILRDSVLPSLLGEPFRIAAGDTAAEALRGRQRLQGGEGQGHGDQEHRGRQRALEV